MGRPVGTRELDVDQILLLVKLSNKGLNRREISDEVGVAKRTVWSYQKGFNFV